MKLQPDPSSALNTVTRYDFDYIEINQVRLNHSFLVMPEGPIVTWNATSFEELHRSHFSEIVQMKPELVILGTGQQLRFPKPELLQDLIQAKIGFETMDTKAACRTYNILMGEGRLVLGAFLFNPLF